MDFIGQKPLLFELCEQDRYYIASFLCSVHDGLPSSWTHHSPHRLEFHLARNQPQHRVGLAGRSIIRLVSFRLNL